MNLEIYVNDRLVDIGPKTQFALSIKYFDINDITSRYTNYSNQVKLPFTKVNDDIFKQARLTKSTGKNNNLIIRVVQRGKELFSDYVGVVQNITDGYGLTMFSNETDLLKLLEQYTIPDVMSNSTIDLPPAAEVFTNAILTANRNITNNSKYKSPVIDYGQIGQQSIVIDNFDFSDTEDLRSWEQVGSSFATDFSLAGIVILNGTNQSSKTLRQTGHAFRNGNNYTITLRYNITGFAGVASQTARIRLYNTVTGTSLIFASQVDVVGGAKTLSATVLLTNDYDSVGITFTTSGTGVVTTDTTDIVVTSSTTTVNVRIPCYLPLIGYLSLLRGILVKAGKNDVNQFLDGGETPDENMLNVTPSFSEFKYPDKWVLSKTDKVETTAGQIINLVGAAQQHITWNTDIYHGDQLTSQVYRWWGGVTANEWGPEDSGGSIKIYSDLKLNITVSAIAGGATVGMSIVHIGTGGGTISIVPIVANGTYDISLKIDGLVLGTGAHQVYVQTYNASGIGSVTVAINSGYFYNTVDNIPFSKINWHALLPNINGREYIKDVLVRFCAMIRTIPKTNEVVIMPLDQIANSPYNVLDWTSKRDTSIEDSTSSAHKFAKRNVFKDGSQYVESDNSFAALSIDDDTLDDEKTIYQSFLHAPLETIIGDSKLKVPKIPIYDEHSKTVDDTIAEPKMVLVRLRSADAATDGTIQYADTNQASYRVAVYSDPAQVYRADWKYFLGKYYKTYNYIINNYKVVTRYYMLTDEDIDMILNPRLSEFYYESAFVKIFDNGEYFIINTLHSYIPGEKTKVDLIKIV